MMRKEETWLGVGIKSGGMLTVYGYESVSGVLWNLKNPSDEHQFTLKGLRIGVGLGGGGAVTCLFIFNVKNIYRLNGGA